MKILAIIILIIAGSLPISAQTLATQAEPKDKRTFTSADLPAKTSVNQARKRRISGTPNATHNVRSKRVIETVGAVYLTLEQSFQFTAGDSIVLNPGFEVDSTTEFSAEIQASPVISTSVPAIAAVENAGALKTFTLYPNPASEQFHVQYEVHQTAVVSLALYNLEGTPVQYFVTAQQQESGSYKLTLPVNKLPSGVYVVSLKINNQTINQRIILR